MIPRKIISNQRSCGVGLILLLLLSACQKKPALSPAADSLSSIEAPPMGATTYNDELKRELSLLDDLLTNRFDETRIAHIKSALMTGDATIMTKDPQSVDAHLAKIFLSLPELLHQKGELTENRKLWIKAKYYFQKRRFIEAATLMTEVLKNEPNFIEARNWRARAIFFLGNPDLAVNELNLIITKVGDSSPYGLDALYLKGAIVFESNAMDAKRLNDGISAWSRYLEKADTDEELKREITASMSELTSRLSGGKSIKNTSRDPFLPNPGYSEGKNAALLAFSKDELLLALELIEQYLKKTYDDDMATIKARILFKTGRLDEAAKLFAAIVLKNGTYAPGFHYQGMAFMLQGQPKDAIASWKKTIELDPAYAQAHGLDQRISVAEKMIAPTKIETH